MATIKPGAKKQSKYVSKDKPTQEAMALGPTDNRSNEEKQAAKEFQQISDVLKVQSDNSNIMGKSTACATALWCLPNVSCNAQISMNQATLKAVDNNNKRCFKPEDKEMEG